MCIRDRYTDSTRTQFKSSVRVECMMQDYAKLLPDTAQVGFTTFPRWLGYSPVKNHHEAAYELSKRRIPPFSASSSEMDLYSANARVLEECGMMVEPATNYFFNQMPTKVPPRVVFYPDFAPSLEKVISSVRGGSITQRSTLVIEGDNITIENLELDGCLWIKSAPGGHVHIRDLVVVNDGWSMTPLDGVFLEPQPMHRQAAFLEAQAAPESLKIRGFKLHKRDSCMIQSGEDSPLYVSGYMGKHQHMPEGMDQEENLLEDLDDHSFDQLPDKPTWEIGRGIGSLVPHCPPKDWSLNPAEEATVVGLFERIDQDGSSELDPSEVFFFCDRNLSMVRRMMSQLDVNTDGKVSLDEWKALFVEMKKTSQYRISVRFIEQQLDSHNEIVEARSEKRMWGHSQEEAAAQLRSRRIRADKQVVKLHNQKKAGVTSGR
eukprot:TRINITY_DN18664_c0_g1_i2.p1 TRINITY_DN18664_c0_g1~~TRINITY_DN18664_c0_g1_i2.p1  ORF type:complete len:432 (+),score=117.05 TRINITY_DN18664_c0_g1_i2:116-1411(+)